MESAREDADVETSSADYARRFAGAVGAWFLDVQARITLDLLAAARARACSRSAAATASSRGPLAEAGHAVTVHGSAGACGQRVQPSWTRAARASRRATCCALPWPDRAFDVVLAFRLLPHVERWRELVGRAGRVARRAVIVDYPTRRSVNAVSGALFGAEEGGRGEHAAVSRLLRREIAEAFAARGLPPPRAGRSSSSPWRSTARCGRAALAARSGVAARAGPDAALGSPVIRGAERRG